MRGLAFPLVIVAGLVLIASISTCSVRSAAARQSEWVKGERLCPACRYVSAIDEDIYVWSCSRCGRLHVGQPAPP